MQTTTTAAADNIVPPRPSPEAEEEEEGHHTEGDERADEDDHDESASGVASSEEEDEGDDDAEATEEEEEGEEDAAYDDDEEHPEDIEEADVPDLDDSAESDGSSRCKIASRIVSNTLKRAFSPVSLALWGASVATWSALGLVGDPPVVALGGCILYASFASAIVGEAVNPK